jgi:hypothetical protein
MRPILGRRLPSPVGAAPEDDARIIELNPWWVRDDWLGADPHLRRLRSQPVTLPARLVDDFDIVTPGVHTIRGPRQVGKSTDLKLLAERALKERYQPRQVIYLALDLLEDQPIAALARQIERAKALAASDDRCLLLLDEVTAVANWQTAVKALWDRGVIDEDVVVCTGSSAIDLARGTSERLPGRRGRGHDHLVLPQSFDVFASALIPGLPPSPALTLSGLLTPDGHDALRQVQIHGPQLEMALERYVRFGGLPAAVVEAATGAETPSEDVERVLWDSLRREISRKGASEPAAGALLERVMRSLGSKTNWSHMARDMAVPLGRRGTGRPDHKTLRDYVEFLAGGYFLLIVYFWKRDADSSSVSSDKKVYFGDPLLHQITRNLYSPGLPFDMPALVENLVALALYRRYEPAMRQIEGFLAPSELHVWETSRRTEVDFVCGPRAAIDAAEVKYQSRIDRRELSGLKRAFPDRPAVMITRDELELTEAHALVPAHILLWALG